MSTTPPSSPIDWQVALSTRWQALGHELLGLDTGPRRPFGTLVHEIERLAIVAALFQTRGNITHAAQRLGTYRKLVRQRLAEWSKDNPELVPSRPTRARRKQKRRRRRKAPAGAKPRGESHDARPPMQLGAARSDVARRETVLPSPRAEMALAPAELARPQADVTAPRKQLPEANFEVS